MFLALYGFPRFRVSWGIDEKFSSKSLYYILEIKPGSFRQRLGKSNLLFRETRFEQVGLSLSFSLSFPSARLFVIFELATLTIV